MDWKTF